MITRAGLRRRRRALSRLPRDLFDASTLRILRELVHRRGFESVPDSPVFPHGREKHPTEPPSVNAIPKIIFQTWKNERLPANYSAWAETLRSNNPDHQMILWTDDDNADFVYRNFPGLRELWDSFPSEIFRVDLVRPLFLYKYGGFYFDLDCEALTPIPPSWREQSVLLGQMGRFAELRNSLPNATFALRPGEAFWLIYRHEILIAV